MKAKSLKKLLVAKEVCSWLSPGLEWQNVCSQENISTASSNPSVCSTQNSSLIFKSNGGKLKCLMQCERYKTLSPADVSDCAKLLSGLNALATEKFDLLTSSSQIVDSTQSSPQTCTVIARSAFGSLWTVWKFTLRFQLYCCADRMDHNKSSSRKTSIYS